MARRRLLGFTLIEQLAIIGILALLAGTTVGITIRYLITTGLDAEGQILISVLEEARSQALANTDNRAHGVAVTENNLVVFAGESYASRDVNKDRTYPRNVRVAISGATEVTFAQLTAQAPDTAFTLTQDNVTYVVTVNQEGTIDWLRQP